MSEEQSDQTGVLYRVSPALRSDEVNDLFAAAWVHHEWRDFEPILVRSLTYVCAYLGSSLVGFVNVAWDGGAHGFLLDTTVHPNLRRRGIGRRLVLLATNEARECGIQWLHVDFEPHLRRFYEGCGFRPTEAGLLRLDSGNND